MNYRMPDIKDGAKIGELVRNCPPLELNSCYSYILICAHFRDTCVVARDAKGEVVGFLSAYCPPQVMDVIFIWQVAVRSDMRGQGIATGMIKNLLKRKNLNDISYVETTVTPSNKQSYNLFHSIAKKFGGGFSERVLFPGSLFGNADHEDEILLRIGPINIAKRHGLF